MAKSQILPHPTKTFVVSWGRLQNMRMLVFVPLAWLLLERLYVPFEYASLSSYLNVETTAVTTKAKRRKFDASKAPTLSELTTTQTWLRSCQANTELISNVVATGPEVPRTKIPRIIHQTAKSRCLTPAFAAATSKWKLDGYSYYFHDEDAMNSLLLLDFPEFPHLKAVIRNCVNNGTLKADLWRYLVLYVYGGVYADFDSAPNEFSADTIGDEDDGFFLVEQFHVLSQWFMAMSPRHPLMFYAIHHALLGLMESEDTWKTPAHSTTGPHILHKAFQDFRRDAGVYVEPLGSGYKPVAKGMFQGADGRSVTVVGEGENENQYVQRQAMSERIRKKDYRTMGMTHFSSFIQPNSKQSGMSCLDAMLKDTFSAIIS